MGIQFGSFTAICETAALVICPLVETSQGVEPTCYSRNVEIGGTLIFQPCEFASVDWFLSERGFLLLVHGRRFALTSVLSRTSAASWHTESFFATLESVIGFEFVCRVSCMSFTGKAKKRYCLEEASLRLFFSCLALYVAFAVANTVSPSSNMLCSHRCHYNDCHHDHTYTEQVYGSR